MEWPCILETICFSSHCCMQPAWNGCRLGSCTWLLELHSQVYTSRCGTQACVWLPGTKKKSHTHSHVVCHKTYYKKSLPKRYWMAPNITRAALNSGGCAICYLEHLAKQKTAIVPTLKWAYCSCCAQVQCFVTETKPPQSDLLRSKLKHLHPIRNTGLFARYTCLNW